MRSIWIGWTMIDQRKQRLAFARLVGEHFEKGAAKDRFALQRPGSESLAAWFLGPKAENQAMMARLLMKAFDSHC
jgi:hypothetical protein